MGVIPKDIKGSGGGGNFLKASDFEVEGGLTLKVMGFEKVRANNADYGANEQDFLYTSGRLGLGETFRYTFEQNGQPCAYDSKSATFFISFSQADPEIGDEIVIEKTGTGRNTQYKIEVQ